MPRFFITAGQRDGDRVRIDGADGAHLARALRVRPGERLTLVDDEMQEHTVVVEAAHDGVVQAHVVATRPAGGEPSLEIHVLQAIPQQGMDTCVEGLVVAGAASVRPVLTARSVRRPDPSGAHARVQRWSTVAREAAQMAGRGRIPPVYDVQLLMAALDGLPGECRILACVIASSAVPLATVRPESSGSVALIIGPEGGLTEDETALLHASGAQLVHLGERVAPSRLAGVLGVTLLLAGSGDLQRSAAHTIPDP